MGSGTIICGGFPKIRGSSLGGPYNKDYSIFGSISGRYNFGQLTATSPDLAPNGGLCREQNHNGHKLGIQTILNHLKFIHTCTCPVCEYVYGTFPK